MRGRTLVMGILNITPDSFYAGSRKRGTAEALDSALEMETAGADIIDIGGESTRPGSDFVGAEEEIARVVPVISAIRERTAIPISVDTRKAAVAEAALSAGADMVNDVAALRDDPGLADVVRKRGVPVVLMHMRGTPKTMQENPEYADPVREITEELRSLVQNALSLGIWEERIIVDPGIGFGKRLSDNLAILRNLDLLAELGLPVLVGLSRKSFIGGILDKPAEERLWGTLAANSAAVMKGAAILRVHDVAATADLVKVLHAIRGGG